MFKVVWKDVLELLCFQKTSITKKTKIMPEIWEHTYFYLLSYKNKEYIKVSKDYTSILLYFWPKLF